MMSLLQLKQLTVSLSKDHHYPLSKPKHKQKQTLCLDKAYHSKEIGQEIVKR
jgi:hypothetical protein